jgi:hemerythrin-like domain-containing protein
MADILKTLKSEHDQLSQLFEQMDATTDRAAKTRTQLLEKIEALLVPHAKWEEMVFYPAFAKRADSAGLKSHAEAIEEHRAVEMTVLPDLKGADVDSRQFAGSAKALADMIKHHAREEENAIFTAMRDLYSAEERADMDAEYAEWKESAVSDLMMVHAKVKTAVKGAMRNHQNPM